MPVALLVAALDIYCVVHCIRHRNHMAWMILILGVPIVGSAIYLLTEALPVAQNRRRSSMANPLRYRPPADQNTLSLSHVYLREQEGQNYVSNPANQPEAENLFCLAETALASKEYEEAIQLLSRIRAQYDYRPGLVRLMLAQAYAANVQPKKAEKLFEQLKKQAEPVYALEYARFLIQQKHFEKAQDLLEKLQEECELRDETRWLVEIETEMRHLKQRS